VAAADIDRGGNHKRDRAEVSSIRDHTSRPSPRRPLHIDAGVTKSRMRRSLGKRGPAKTDARAVGCIIEDALHAIAESIALGVSRNRLAELGDVHRDVRIDIADSCEVASTISRNGSSRIRS